MRISLGVVAAVGIMLATPAMAVDWYYASNSNSQMSLIDADSVRSKGQTREFDWFLADYNSKIRYQLRKARVDCHLKTLIVQSTRSYDAGRNFLSEKAGDGTRSSTGPNTAGSYVVEEVCGRIISASEKNTDPYDLADELYYEEW